MRILIDADGCPVVDNTVKVAREFHLECIILCDTSHYFEKDGATTITVSRGPDSVDFVLVNMIEEGDIVVTQDYGLAAMCLARKSFVLNQNGMEYHDGNMECLLMMRHTAKKIRNAGGRLKGNRKREKSSDINFEKRLRQLILEQLPET